MRYKILGIDAGQNFAIAILDLDGNLILTEKGKGKEKEKILQDIFSQKNIKYVAFDRAKANKEIKHIASLLNAKLVLPKEDISLKKKERLLKKFEKRFSVNLRELSKHEKDALSSALFCFSLLEKRLKKLKDKIPEVTQKEKYEFLKGRYISEIKKLNKF